MSMQQHLERGNSELDVFTSHLCGVAILTRKIHHAHSGLNHALRTHAPRTQLAARLLRLEQMIADWMYVTGRWDAGGTVSDAALTATAQQILKINIERLREEVRR